MVILLDLVFVTIQAGSLPGAGLNEAAVQLMASKALNIPYENVKYFDINLQSNTPTYYPLECALVNQIAYVIGENVLFESTINSNNNFKEQYISLTSEKTFIKIQKNIDLLIDIQCNLVTLYSILENTSIDEAYAKKVSKKINAEKSNIRELFMATQKLILTSYFDNAINLAYTPKSLENYRNKLYLFKNLVCSTKDYDFYNKYYIDKMMEIEKRYEIKSLDITALTVIKPSFILKLINKIKLLFGLNNSYKKIKS